VDGQLSISGRGRHFYLLVFAPRSALGPTQFRIQWISGTLSLGGKAAEA
jgi:hypothetical protein